MQMLTTAEREIAALICRGLDDSEIAESKRVSNAVVSSLVSSMSHKLRAKNRFELIVSLYHNGIVQFDDCG
jgi:DNA-binding NarL/FixJ family response regulator